MVGQCLACPCHHQQWSDQVPLWNFCASFGILKHWYRAYHRGCMILSWGTILSTTCSAFSGARVCYLIEFYSQPRFPHKTLYFYLMIKTTNACLIKVFSSMKLFVSTSIITSVNSPTLSQPWWMRWTKYPQAPPRYNDRIPMKNRQESKT